MKPSPKLTAELARLVATRRKHARISITGASMEPSLRAGMVVDVEPLVAEPRVGDILIYRSQRSLVAHRLIGLKRRAHGIAGGVDVESHGHGPIERYLTSGDAQPMRIESVPPHCVVGRVGAVWASADANAKRVDGQRFERHGVWFAQKRHLRVNLEKLRSNGKLLATLLFSRPARTASNPVFAAIVSATRAFERGDYAGGVEILVSLERARLIETARRHHLSGCFSDWFEEASRAAVEVPSDLADVFRKMRFANAIQTGRVLALVHDVRNIFGDASIPHIFLKGAGRLAAREPKADVQFSGDVDVIVPALSLERARAALRAARYTSVPSAYRRSSDDRWHHHCEAMMSPAVAVPVEIHFALAAPALVTQRLDYETLESFARRVTTGTAEANVVDTLGAAIVLAYHARDLHVWRDIVLLSRLLRDFDAATRKRFDAFIMPEQRDGLRLTSAVAAADAMTCDRKTPIRAVRRYLAWAQVREDLSPLLSCDIVEAVIGRCPMPKLHLHPPATFATWLRCWIRNLVSLPSIAYAAYSVVLV